MSLAPIGTASGQNSSAVVGIVADAGAWNPLILCFSATSILYACDMWKMISAESSKLFCFRWVRSVSSSATPLHFSKKKFQEIKRYSTKSYDFLLKVAESSKLFFIFRDFCSFIADKQDLYLSVCNSSTLFWRELPRN